MTFFPAHVIGFPSKHENCSTLRVILTSVAPVWTSPSVWIQPRNDSKTQKGIKFFAVFTFSEWTAVGISRNFVNRIINEHSPGISACQSPTSFDSLMGLIQVLSHFKVISQSAETTLAVDSMSLVRFKKLSGLYKTGSIRERHWFVTQSWKVFC